jgi:hypothetical protein
LQQIGHVQQLLDAGFVKVMNHGGSGWGNALFNHDLKNLSVTRRRCPVMVDNSRFAPMPAQTHRSRL